MSVPRQPSSRGPLPHSVLLVSISVCLLLLVLSENQHSDSHCYLRVLLAGLSGDFTTRLASNKSAVRPAGEQAQTVAATANHHSSAQKIGLILSSPKSPSFVWSNEHKIWTLRRGQNSGNSVSDDSSTSNCVWPNDEGCDRGKLGADSERHGLPHTAAAADDRIVEQLTLDKQLRDGRIFNIYTQGRFVGDDYSSHSSQGQDGNSNRQLFLDEGCVVSGCQMTGDIDKADALIFPNSDVFREPQKRARREQIWIAYLLESPPNTFDRRFVRLHRGKHKFNWTASYRTDSDIVTPYSKFLVYEDQVSAYLALKRRRQLHQMTALTSDGDGQLEQMDDDVQSNYAASSAEHKRLIRDKGGKVAWLASNCHAANGRLDYARELSKYIQVDIYGRCGNLTCDKWNQSGCLNMINRHYKFYLSFENSNSRQYITEKLFANALGHNDLNHLVLPIVMGAPRDDYELLAPAGSFIHIDDFGSAKELAHYLKLLDANDALYYSYFRWKTMGRFIDTKFMCRVCAMLHDSFRSNRVKWYDDLKEWYLR